MRIRWIAAGSLATLALSATAAAAPPGAPLNDDYLSSLRLNGPGSRLERKDTLRDVRDTTNASVQGDVFNPPRSGGPAEPTECGGAGYGKTVWYDFYPDVSGLVRLRANGYDTVISVVQFNRQTAVPDFGGRACSNASGSTSEEFLTRVRKGRSYTVQLGGVNNTAGNLEFLFDFLADTDGDGVLDDTDKCDRLKGPRTNAGCPPRLKADATIRARPTPNGIELVSLSVAATRGSRVEVRCSRGCRRQVKRARRTVRFPALRGTRLAAGSAIEVRTTKRNSIGSYLRYRILRGNFSKTERCLNPGSNKPRRRCG